LTIGHYLRNLMFCRANPNSNNLRTQVTATQNWLLNEIV
jgi:hypothetical protein